MINMKLYFSKIFLAFLLATQSFSIAATSCKTSLKVALTASELANQLERPTMNELLKIPQEERRQFIKNSTENSKSPQNVFNVMFEVVVEVLKNWDGRQIVFLGRDAELIYDSAQFVLRMAGFGEEVQSRIRLINLSRPVIESSTYTQIHKYLEAQAGVNLKDVINGQQKFVIFDTGNRGSIYLRLLSLIVDQIKLNDPEWKIKLLNVFSHIDFLLLATEQNPTINSVVAEIKSMKDFDKPRVQDILDKYQDNLYFKQLDLPKSEKAALIPKDLYTRFRWVVDNIEYQPHWEGRTLRLTQDGRNRSKQLENDPREDKEGYLARQLQLLEFLESSKVVSTYINNLKEKPKKQVPTPKKNSTVARPTSTESKIKSVQVVPGNALNIGDRVTLNGKSYEVVSELGEGKRGIVYKVRDSKGKDFALKIAKHNDAETLDSFKRESDKQLAYEKAKVSFARILEQEPHWILKDLVEGERADQWLKNWDLKKEPTGGVKMEALIKLFKGIASKSIYIGDMNPTNLIWSGDKWVIIDSGDATIPMEKAKALKRFFEKNGDYKSDSARWKRYFPNDQKRKIFSDQLEKGLQLSSNLIPLSPAYEVA